ncbi:MAG: hypothetical protein WDA53_00600 [Bacillota bacterium]
MKKDFTSPVKGLLITALAVVSIFTLTGGIGTTCVAWNAANLGPFAVMVPYAPFYKSMVVVNILVGLALFIITYAFVRSEKWAYNAALITLFIGGGSGLVKMYMSQTIRGGTAPTNVRVYFTLAALVIFLIVRLPFIWNRIDLAKKPEGESSYVIPTGVAFLVGGISQLAITLFAMPSHIVEGVNYVNYLAPQFYAISGILMAVGAGLLLTVKLKLNLDARIASVVKSIYNVFVSSKEAKEFK